MTQMDLLDLLATPTPALAIDRDADAIAHYLAPWQLNRVIHSLENPRALATERGLMVSGQFGGGGQGRAWSTTAKGIVVTAWPGESEGWLIRWPTVWDVVRRHVTPPTAQELHAAVREEAAHMMAFQARPFVPYRNATDESRAADEVWSVEVAGPFFQRSAVLAGRSRLAADAILPRSLS